jgi:hypothetical protein
MTSNATFGLDNVVFILEWPGHFRVALGADEILLCRESLKLVSKAAMGLMTICAQNYSLNYLMTECRRELRPELVMALKAEIRLSDPEEIFCFVRGVDAVAANAAYLAPAMGRAFKDRVRSRVASQATIIYKLGSGLRRVEDF